MGLREKVALTIVIIALIQIACRHCMPRTPRKAFLKRYLNDLKTVKNNPVPTPYSPSRVNKTPKQTFGKTAQNGRISQNSLPKKSLYKTYNFPENEYPVDNSPRDPFRIGMNFNENNHVTTLLKARNLQSSAISELKKEMKMKRKLLSNKQMNNENRQLKTDMSLINFAPSPDSTRFLDSETFPEVQYPLNTMDTWGPNYWNYLPFTQEKPFPRIGHQTLNHKAKEDINQPFTRLTKAKASKYLQSYNKLKEEHRRTSTENSKRSNVGQTGLNFTKTATCERVSDDFITAGLVSNIPSNSTEMRKALTSSTKITASSENTCPVTEYPYHPVPIPYKVIENNNENISPALGLNYNTEELEDVDNSDIAQTLQLIQEILFNDDTCSAVSPGNFSTELEKNISTSDCSDFPENKDIPTSKESSQEVSDDMPPVGILQNNLPSVPEETIPENIPTVAGPLNVRMLLPSSEPLHEIEALTNTPKSSLTKMASLSNGFAVPSSTSIIIIPMNNNAVGKSKSHMFETISDTPIIGYLPSTHTPSFNQIVSSSLDYTVPNNQLYNVLSNMAPLQNDNPFSPALVSELLNSNSDSGSSLPIDETLPTNSMCYNNENSPSSIREKTISDIILHKLLTDDAPFVTTTRDEKMSEPPIETGDIDVNSNTLPPITDFEHPLFDFSGNEFTSLSHGPYNNVLNNELPIVAHEIDSDHQILNDSSNSLFIPTQNVTSEHLHNTTSMDSVSEDSLSEIPNDVPPVALDKNFSSATPTDSMEILKTNTLLPESIPNLQEPVGTLTESLPQPIDTILLSTTLIEPPSAELPQPKESPVSPTLLSETFSDNLPEIMDAVLSTTPVSATTIDSTSQHIGNTPSPEINSSPMMTDMTLKTELYKIRQILDKMLSIETPTYSQPPPIDTTPLRIYDSDRLLLPMNEMPTESVRVPALDKKILPLPATDSPIDSLQQVHETLPRISVDGTPTDTLPLPGNKLVIPNKLLIDTPSLPIDKTVPTTLESETSADNKPYLLDKLIKPLSEIVTSRTKDTPDNGLSHKMDDLSLKMDLKFPNIYEVSSGDLLLSVDSLPTKIDPENTTNPGVSTNELPTQVVETLTPVSEVPVSNLPKPTDMLSLPADEVLKDASPDVATGVKALMSGFTDKLLQDFPSSIVPSDGLPTLPVNVFKLPIHETFPDGQLNEILSTGPLQNDHLPSSLQKLIPDLSLSNAFTNEPSLEDDSPSLFIDKNIKIPHSTVDTKDLPLELEHLLSPENNATPDSVVKDIPSAVSPSLNKGLQTTNLDQTSDEVLSVSDIPRDELTLPVHKMSPITDDRQTELPLPINKTPTTSKLPITKALLKNVLSDINKAGLLSVAQTLPVTPHALFDKTLHYVDVKSPVFETKNILPRPEEKIFPNSEHTANLIDYEPFSETPVDTSIADLPSELLKTKPYIPTDNVKDHDKNETQSLNFHDLPVPIESGSPPKDTTKTPSSSKLSIPKELLENVLSDITTKSFLVPVAQSLPVTSPSVVDKTLSPISHIFEDIPALQVDEILPDTSFSNHQTDNVPITIADNLPLPIHKTFSESQSLFPTELSSPIDNLSLDIPNISIYDKEQDECENLSSKNPTDDLSSATPMPGILSLSKDTPSDLTLPNNKASSKLSITKALLENVLSDITTKGFSVPVAQSSPVISPSELDKILYYVESPISHITEDSATLPVDKILPHTSLYDHSTDNLPISIEDNLPLPINKTFSELQCLDIPTELSSPSGNIANISRYGKEQNESENPPSRNPTDDLSSASPMKGILSFSKDTLRDVKNPNNKIPSSSKLPITKALLENVLSDITTKGFSVPVAQSLPVTSPSVLDKTRYYVESPISHFTEDSPTLPVDKTLLITSHSDQSTDILPISIEDIVPFPMDETFSKLQSLDIPTELSSPVDNMCPDIPDISMYDKEQDESANPSSKNPTGDLSSASPMKGILSLSKDMLRDVKNPNNKIPSTSKLPITKALLENVLSDITTKGFSVPVAQSLPVTSPSVLDKTRYYVESPISHITEYSPTLPVDKTPPITSHSGQSTDILPISMEDTVPLPIDKTFSKLQSLDIPTDLSSPVDNMRPDIPDISMYDKEQDESENPSSEKPTGDLSSASPMKGILSLSKDTLTDVKNPNNKIPSSSKLPITKALLENVLSDITTKGFSVPVAQSLPVTSPSVLDKTRYYVESPLSHITEYSPTLPVDKTPPITSHSGQSTDILPISIEDTVPLPMDEASPMNGILSLSKDTLRDVNNPNNKIPSSSKLPINKALLENVLSDITTKGFSVPVAQSSPVISPSELDKILYYVESHISHITEDSATLPVDNILPHTSFSDHSTDNLPISNEDNLPLPIDKPFSELQCLDIPTELSSPSRDTANISRYDIEQNESENPPSRNPTDDLSSASPMKGILSLSNDTLRDVKNSKNKIPSPSKLPITKALLENVLSDITRKGFSIPVAQSLPVTSPLVLDKTRYYVESPISHITEYSPTLPVDKSLPITSHSGQPTDILAVSIEDTVPLPIDKTFSELQSLDIPTELSSPVDNMCPDIPDISMYDKEQDESANPSSKNPTGDLSSASPMKGILSLSKDMLRDVKNPNNKIPSSSKLPITKALLENILSDITTKGFSVPVAQSLPVTSPSVLDKTRYYVESPISHITEYSPTLPVDKTPPITSHSGQSTDILPISIEDTVPLPMDEASPMKGILSLSKDTLRDVNNPNNKIPSSSKLPITKALLENVLSDISTKGFSVPVAQSLPVTSPSVLDKTRYYVESPISHITEYSPTLPVDKTPPITSHSGQSTDILPISIEDTVPLPIDKTFSELQSLNIPTELSSPLDNMHPDIPNISMYDKEQDESENPSSKNPTGNLSAASPMKGILSFSKDTLRDVKNPNNKIPSSSKLPITKALLENVLSDITTKSFSVPVAQSLPVTSPSVLDKTRYYVESPISHITEDSPTLPVDKSLPITSHSGQSTDILPISIEDTVPLPMDEASPMKGILSLSKDTLRDVNNPNNKIPSSSKLPITKALLENVLSDISTKGFSVPVAQSLPVTSPSVLDKTRYYVESPISHITEYSPTLPVDKTPPITSHSGQSTDILPISIEDTVPLPIDKTFSELQSLNIPTELSSPLDNMHPDIPNISMYDKEQDESENPSSKNPTGNLSAASPMKGILSFSKDTLRDVKNPNNKIPSSSKLPITKALLENVLSDITTKSFSVPVAQSLPVTSPSVLDKTRYYVESPISHITEDSPTLPVDKTLPITSHSDQPTDILPISIEDTVPLPMDEASPMKGILSLSKDTLRDVNNPNNKIPSSSKLPITKALLENVLSDITTKGFSVPVAQSSPVISTSELDKILYYVESHISHITEHSATLPVDNILPHTSLSDHSTDNLPISIEDNLPLPIDKTFSELQCLDIPTELSSPSGDIANISRYGKEQNESENPPSRNPTDDLSSASPMKGILSLSNDTLRDVKNSNNKIPSPSKLPITKALLENVLSDITRKGFSIPVAQSLPVTSPLMLDKTRYYVESPISHITEYSPTLPVDKSLPITSHSGQPTDILAVSIEDTVPLPIDKTFSELQSLDIPTELSSPLVNMRPDIPNISMYDTEQDESENPSSKNPTGDLSSASPMIGILSLSKDTLRDVKYPNNKIPLSSKLPITKALLENVLSDITTRGFSVLVAQSSPVISPSELDKILYYEEFPISQITDDSPALSVDKILPHTSLSDHSTDNLPISIEDNLPLPIDKPFSELQCLDIPTELSSPSRDTVNISRYDIEQNESENPPSKNPTGDLSSASPMKGILSLSKDTLRDVKNSNNKIPSPSKLPITKALLENVLSDISTKGFSVPVAQSLPVTSPSVLDKTRYYVESPISHITEYSPTLPVDKTPPITSHSGQSTDILPISIEDTVPLPIDKTFSELQSLDIPTELSSPVDNMRPDIPDISMYDKEQDESENPSSKNPTGDLSSASPMKGILSLSKDTLRDVEYPNNKIPSSSKLPITKALLENVLSDINTRGFSLPVAQALSVASRSQLDKTLYFLESPVSDVTEKSSVILTDNFPSSGINEDVGPRPTDTTLLDNPILDIPTDKLLLDKIHNSDILTDDGGHEDNSEMLTDDVEDRDMYDNYNDDVKDEDEYKFDFLTDDVDDKDKSDIWTDEVEDNDKSYHWTDDIEIEDSNESLFSDDPTDDVTSVLPLPRTKPYMASRIPIAKALLEIVLSNITDRGIHP